MPIKHLLVKTNLTPEQRYVCELAFEATLKKLGLVDRNDPVCEIVAQKVIRIAATSTAEPSSISEAAFSQLVERPTPVDLDKPDHQKQS